MSVTKFSKSISNEIMLKANRELSAREPIIKQKEIVTQKIEEESQASDRMFMLN